MRAASPFHLQLAARIPLQEAATAADAIARHHLGRIVLDIP